MNFFWKSLFFFKKRIVLIQWFCLRFMFYIIIVNHKMWISVYSNNLHCICIANNPFKTPIHLWMRKKRTSWLGDKKVLIKKCSHRKKTKKTNCWRDHIQSCQLITAAWKTSCASIVSVIFAAGIGSPCVLVIFAS